MTYNYKEAVLEDVLESIKENYTHEELLEHLETRTSKDDFFEKLYDDLWVCDSVTGNASGSYTFSTYQAEENLCHNLDLLREALAEFDGDYHKALEEGAEYCDVTIRCYLLYEAIYKALTIIEEELETL